MLHKYSVDVLRASEHEFAPLKCLILYLLRGSTHVTNINIKAINGATYYSRREYEFAPLKCLIFVTRVDARNEHKGLQRSDLLFETRTRKHPPSENVYIHAET